MESGQAGEDKRLEQGAHLPGTPSSPCLFIPPFLPLVVRFSLSLLEGWVPLLSSALHPVRPYDHLLCLRCLIQAGWDFFFFSFGFEMCHKDSSGHQKLKKVIIQYLVF